MSLLYTWTISNKQVELTCVANDMDEARRKALDVVKELEGVAQFSDGLIKKRNELVKQIPSAPDNEDEEKSTFSPPSKKILHYRITNINQEIENFCDKNLHANLHLGWTPLNTFANTDSQLAQIIIKTEPKVTQFYPVTIKRMGS